MNGRALGSVSLRVRYRPVRIGWCVEDGDLEGFEKAVRLTHVFWGGRFNPVIPCGNRELARALVAAFNVDLLHDASGSAAVGKIIDEFPYLRMPLPRKLFGTVMPLPTFLDIRHPAERWRSRREEWFPATQFACAHDDPLRLVLLATCGGYPEIEDTAGTDYAARFDRDLGTGPELIDVEKPLPGDLWMRFTPNTLTDHGLKAESTGIHERGFYIGCATRFSDLVDFWNLRASNTDVYFHDPAHAQRMFSSFRDGERITVWTSSGADAPDLTPFTSAKGREVSPKALDWRSPEIYVPQIFIDERYALGFATDHGGQTSVRVQLPEKPFSEDWSQRVVVSVTAENVGESCLTPPFEPRLNTFYGGDVPARSELDGLGFIIPSAQQQMELRAIAFDELVCGIFQTYGIKASLSDAGKVTRRLISQMGGLDGCQVFKIAGVRNLIKKYTPDKSFKRSAAIDLIHNFDEQAKKPRFDEYKWLYKDAHEAFRELLGKEVFRAGLELCCPTCGLKPWVPLEDLKSEIECVYCGATFNVLPQLRDRDWAYRRSGLFGRDDNQLGGIPVALTLLQLEAVLKSGQVYAWTSCMDLEPDTTAIDKCEMDFVVVARSFGSESPQLVLGECKDAGGSITSRDVDNLTQVAKALKDRAFDVFLVFSKCGKFTESEINEIKLCHAARNNVILFSQRELESERVEKPEDVRWEFHLHHPARSLADLVEKTARNYFNPSPEEDA
jgi:hypothetical protein